MRGWRTATASGWLVVVVVALLLATLLAFLSTARPALAEPYRLGAGDALRVTVFGEPDLSGAFTVDGSGRVALPLVGPVVVGGATLPEAETAIAATYAAGYLKSPQVSVEVTNFRPFYILGEVQKPGAYPYASGLTVMGAVAVGGGFTYRADEDDIDITRAGAALDNMPLDAPVLPGDVIHVRQRFF